MTTNRYRSPGSSRGSSRKKRRHEYESNPKNEKHGDLDSRSSMSSCDSRTHSPILAPSSIAAPTRHRRHTNESHRGDNDDDNDDDDDDGDAHARRHRRSSQSSRRRHRKQLRDHHQHHHHHRPPKALLPAPDEKEDEETGYRTAVAIREELPVQTVSPRTYRRDLSPYGGNNNNNDELYGHGPRSLSQRQGPRYPERRRAQGSEPQRADRTADQGFFMAAVMVVVSVFICLGEVD